MGHSLVVTLLLTQLAGCAPFVVPPARLSIGPAMRQGDIADGEGKVSKGPLLAFRAGLHPMQALKDGDRRLLDVGIGYNVEADDRKEASIGRRAPTLYGPYLELGAYPLRLPVSERYALRAGANSSLDILFRDGYEGAGVGLSVGPSFELTGNVTGPFNTEEDDGSVTVGDASGYWAVGLFGNASLRKFEAQYSRGFAAGISFRIPFAFGIACCAVPHFGSSDDSSSSDASSSSSGSTRTRANPRPAK